MTDRRTASEIIADLDNDDIPMLFIVHSESRRMYLNVNGEKTEDYWAADRWTYKQCCDVEHGDGFCEDFCRTDEGTYQDLMGLESESISATAVESLAVYRKRLEDAQGDLKAIQDTIEQVLYLTGLTEGLELARNNIKGLKELAGDDETVIRNEMMLAWDYRGKDMNKVEGVTVGNWTYVEWDHEALLYGLAHAPDLMKLAPKNKNKFSGWIRRQTEADVKGLKDHVTVTPGKKVKIDTDLSCLVPMWARDDESQLHDEQAETMLNLTPKVEV